MLVNQKPAPPVSESRPLQIDREGPNTSVILLVTCVVLIPVLIMYAMGTTNEMQVVAAIIGLLSMMLIFAVPFWGLIVFTALLYIRPEESIPELAGMHLTLVVGIACGLGMGLRLALDRKPLVRTPLLGMMGGFAVVGIFSGGMFGFGFVALNDFVRLLIVVGLVLNLLRNQKQYNRFVTTLILLTTYLAIYSTYLYYSGVATFDQGIARSKGTGLFSDPNDLAATIIAGLVLSMTRVMLERGFIRFVYLLFTLSMLYGFVLTGSRSGLIALAVVLTGGAAALSKKKVAIICIAVVTIGTVLVAAPQRMTNFDTKEESANSRFVFWNEAIVQLRKNPVLGTGYMKFADFNDGMVAHNTFVQCFAELGLPGYFFWIGCVYFAYRRRPGAANDKQTRAGVELTGARLALTGYLAACFWITRTYSPITYIILSLPVAQQIASSEAPSLCFYTSDESGTVWGRIVLICFGSILAIWKMAILLK